MASLLLDTATAFSESWSCCMRGEIDRLAPSQHLYAAAGRNCAPLAERATLVNTSKQQQMLPSITEQSTDRHVAPREAVLVERLVVVMYVSEGRGHRAGSAVTTAAFQATSVGAGGPTLRLLLVTSLYGCGRRWTCRKYSLRRIRTVSLIGTLTNAALPKSIEQFFVSSCNTSTGSPRRRRL